MHHWPPTNRHRGVRRRADLATAVLLLILSACGGRHEGPGAVTRKSLPAGVAAERGETQARAVDQLVPHAAAATRPHKVVLFGDLNVHTTFSLDAFALTLPGAQSDGPHPPADACDFARFCSALDFWAITDHAESSTPQHWAETIASLRECNAVSGRPESPDTVAFLGFEWTPEEPAPAAARSVVYRDLDEGHVPARPIAARRSSTAAQLASPSSWMDQLALAASGRRRDVDLARFKRELSEVEPCPHAADVSSLPASCREVAGTSAELAAKLAPRESAMIVIPETDAPSDPLVHDAARSDSAPVSLFEIYSGADRGEAERHENSTIGHDGSAQRAAAIFADPARPHPPRFGFVGSSHTHQARPGGSCKHDAGVTTTGGLVAVHADGRDRRAIWDALAHGEIYATTGDRILLWFDLLNGPDGILPMGSTAALARPPVFRVRAIGAPVPQPGCPRYVADALGQERMTQLCDDGCYNPSDQRRRITRVEVVRIGRQTRADEPLDGLIEDPWRRFDCPADSVGCAVEFDDPDFLNGARERAYYVRVIEEPTPAGADCPAPAEERAWASPIYLTPNS